jgi:hypothetical protein
LNTTCTTHLLVFFIISIPAMSTVMKLLTMQFSPTLSHFSINLFSNTLSLCSSSLNVRDHVLHPYRPTGKIIVLYTFIE